MQYRHFDFLVEEMSETDAQQLLDEIILRVEMRGGRMGGGFAAVSDADMEFWPVVKKHAGEIGSEIKAQVEGWLAQMDGWLERTIG